MPVPYSGQVSYNDVALETAYVANSPDFTLDDVVNGVYAFSVHDIFNPLSFIQATPNPTDITPTDFYGYSGVYQANWIPINPTPDTLNYGNLLTYDSWPVVGSYPGFGTTVTDMGVFGNGTLMNGMGWSSAAGNGGGAWVLDGIDDYIDTTNGPLYGLDFSVEAWFRVSGNFSQGSLAGQATYGVDDWTTSNMWLLHPNATAGSTTITFYVNENPFGSFRIQGVTTGTLSAGNWYQVVGTYDSANAEMKIYVNGILQNTTTGIFGTGVTNNASNTLVVGGDPRYTFRRLTGNISAFNIYDSQVLSQAEVTQNFNARRTRYGI